MRPLPRYPYCNNTVGVPLRVQEHPETKNNHSCYTTSSCGQQRQCSWPSWAACCGAIAWWIFDDDLLDSSCVVGTGSWSPRIPMLVPSAVFPWSPAKLQGPHHHRHRGASAGWCGTGKLLSLEGIIVLQGSQKVEWWSCSQRKVRLYTPKRLSSLPPTEAGDQLQEHTPSLLLLVSTEYGIFRASWRSCTFVARLSMTALSAVLLRQSAPSCSMTWPLWRRWEQAICSSCMVMATMSSPVQADLVGSWRLCQISDKETLFREQAMSTSLGWLVDDRRSNAFFVDVRSANRACQPTSIRLCLAPSLLVLTAHHLFTDFHLHPAASHTMDHPSCMAEIPHLYPPRTCPLHRRGPSLVAFRCPR